MGKQLKAMIDTMGSAAIGTGSFAEAWAQAQQNNDVWCWMLDDEVENEPIVKPIWHIGNGSFIDAAGSPIFIGGGGSDPDVPTFTQVGQVVTITPSSGSVLHYTINGGAEQTSSTAVEIPINQASITIVAWCVNINGSSSQVTQTYTASAPAAPVMTVGGNVVTQDMTISRNSVVTITASEGDLYVKVGSGNYEKASGSSTTITCSGDTTTISAKTKDPQTSVESNPVTRTFSVAKPNAPQLPASAEMASGSTINVTWSGGTLHYTINSGTEQTASTSPLTLTINERTNIEAWVVDANQESSTHVTRTYTIAVPKLKVKTRGATTMTLTKTDDSTIALNLVDNTGTDNYNEFDLDEDLGGVTTFKSCAFGTKNNILEVDFAGLSFSTANMFSSATYLERVVGLVVNGSIDNLFSGCIRMHYAQVSGIASSINSTFLSTCNFTGTSYQAKDLVLDLSGLTTQFGSGSGVNARDMFQTAKFSPNTPLDISTLDFSIVSWPERMFKNCSAKKLIVGSGFVLNKQNGSTSSLLDDVFTGCEITAVRITTSTPPALSGTKQPGNALLTHGDWVEKLDGVINAADNTKHISIEVPSGSLSAYTSHADWGKYSNYITEYND